MQLFLGMVRIRRWEPTSTAPGNSDRNRKRAGRSKSIFSPSNSLWNCHYWQRRNRAGRVPVSVSQSRIQKNVFRAERQQNAKQYITRCRSPEWRMEVTPEGCVVEGGLTE